MRISVDIFLAGLTLVGVQSCVQTKVESRLPNVIYVFPDQMRNHAMGFWAQEGFREHVNFRADPVLTPVLDSFAREALVLSKAVSNCPLSSPHRGMLLTGAYPHQSGVALNCNSTRPISSLREDVMGIGDVFSRSGYDCAYIGKLHVDFPTPNDPQNKGQYVETQRPVWDAYTPVERRHGFNYWYSYGTYDVHKSPHYWDTQGMRHNITEWSPQHEADKAIEYLRNKGGAVRDGAKPFFMVVSMNPPHSPYNSLDDCMEQDYNLYKDMPLDSLLVRPNVDLTMGKAESARYYFASVSGVDREFGRILNELKRLGLDKNTIVVFSSDHGETMCSQATQDPKNSPYAESMNVPFMVRYPSRIAPRVDSLLLSSPDIMPTLLGLCSLGKAIPATVQGRDFSPIFYGVDNAIERPKAALYIRNIDGPKDSAGLVQSYVPVSRGVKTANYTFVLTINPQTHKLVSSMFFDDLNDPYQMVNLSLEEYPMLAKSHMKALAAELRAINDPWYQLRILSDLLPY